jgi:concanavalin A-like lectin/glucanase superfamily protein
MKYARFLICFFMLLLIPSMGFAQSTTSTQITDFGPQNVWDLRDERGELVWRKIHESCEPAEFGAGRSWSERRHTREKRGQSSVADCIASNMRKEGASPQAIEFTRQMNGEVYMGSFRKMGKVDMVTTVAPLWKDPNVEDLILVNGTPSIIDPWDEIRDLDITTDPLYPSLKGRFPNIDMWPMHTFVSMQQSPQGGQRFILSFTMLNGCSACDLAGFANIAFDFDTTGTFSGKELLYLTENSDRTEPLSPSNPSIPFTIMDEFHGSTLGNAYGITYTRTAYGDGAEFSRRNESRVQYTFSQGFPREGTLEFWIKVDSGYRYSNYKLHQNQDEALIFTTDIAGGDVTWPGSAWLWVKNNGDVSFKMATEKYEKATVLKATKTKFRFGTWHSIGISFGSKGQQIMVDGKLAASNRNTQYLGSGGNHDGPVDLPTIGESVSGFWSNNQHEGGFEGIVAKFRASIKQNAWLLSVAEPSQSENDRDVQHQQ